MTYDLIIVGGGVWGCSAALRAVERGLKSVLLIEANNGVAMESSAKAGGVVTDLLWNPEDIEWVGKSRLLFERAYKKTHDRSILQPYGMLTLFGDSHRDLVQERVSGLKERGTAVETWDTERIVREFPDLDRLSPGMMGLWTPDDKHVNPTAYSEAVLGMARGLGLSLRLGSRVTGLKVDGQRAMVQVGTDTMEADRLLVTAGTWSGKLLETAGYHIPLRPYRVQLASLNMPSGYKLPMVWELATDVYLVPDGPHNLLAGDGTRLFEHDPDDYQTSGDDEFIDSIAEHAIELTSRADEAGLRGAWAGLCGGTPDRRPLLGAVDHHLFVACGDQGIGVMRGPALGELAVDVALGEADAPHLSPLRSKAHDFPIQAGFTLEE